MAKRIDAETKAAMVARYLSDENVQYKTIAKEFGVSATYVSRIIHAELQAGNGIKPDRRSNGELTDDELERRHDAVIATKDPHPRTTDWMQHVTPLHKHKMELERRVEHKQAELDKARQELRDFLATLDQLLKAD